MTRVALASMDPQAAWLGLEAPPLRSGQAPVRASAMSQSVAARR
jgi:hypothetical protein